MADRWAIASQKLSASVRAARARMLRRINAVGVELRTIRRGIAEELVLTFDRDVLDITRDAIARRISSVLGRTVTTRTSSIAGGIRSATTYGIEGARGTVSRLEGPLVTLPSERAAVDFAARLMRAEHSVDGVSLARRLRGHDAASAAATAREIERGLRSGAAAREVATRLRRTVARTPPDLPAYAEELLAARREGGPALRSAIDRTRRIVERLKPGELGLRSAGTRLLRDVERASARDLRRTVNLFVERRAYLAELRIARTEMVRAMSAAYTESMRGTPGVVGYRWMLSSSHPRPDICDLLAGQDVDGLGEGGYRVAPSLPAHPHCICHLEAIIDVDHFSRETARGTGVRSLRVLGRVAGGWARSTGCGAGARATGAPCSDRGVRRSSRGARRGSSPPTAPSAPSKRLAERALDRARKQLRRGQILHFRACAERGVSWRLLDEWQIPLPPYASPAHRDPHGALSQRPGDRRRRQRVRKRLASDHAFDADPYPQPTFPRSPRWSHPPGARPCRALHRRMGRGPRARTARRASSKATRRRPLTLRRPRRTPRRRLRLLPTTA